MENSSSPSKVFIERDRCGLYGLHVSNIPPDFNENDLRDLFYTSGYIKVCKIIKAPDDKRVAFVKFATYEEAAMALKKCNKTKISDYILDVRPAYESQRARSRHSKDKSSSSESLSKQETRNQKSPGNLSNGIPTPESKKAEQRDEREMASKSTTQAPRTYVLPSTSQDIRFSNNGNQYINGSESLHENKTPVNPSTFNKSPTAKPKDTPKHTGIAASFGGLKKTESSHPVTKPKVDPSNKPKDHSTINHITKYLEKTNLDNSHKRGQYMQHQNTNSQHTNIEHSHQKQQHLKQPKDNVNAEDSNLDNLHQRGQPPHSTNVSKWSVAEVAKYYKNQEECSEAMVAFIEEQEIDGNALMLIEESSLLYFMKLGPVLKFLNLREKLKNKS